MILQRRFATSLALLVCPFAAVTGLNASPIELSFFGKYNGSFIDHQLNDDQFSYAVENTDVLFKFVYDTERVRYTRYSGNGQYDMAAPIDVATFAVADVPCNPQLQSWCTSPVAQGTGLSNVHIMSNVFLYIESYQYGFRVGTYDTDNPMNLSARVPNGSFGLLGPSGQYEATSSDFDVFRDNSGKFQLQGSTPTHDSSTLTATINPVPEPGTLALMALPLCGLYFVRRKAVA